MFIITYRILKQSISVGCIPITVTGRTGKCYGSTTLEAVTGFQYLDIPQKEWEAGADQDILTKRTLLPWLVRVRVELDPSCDLGALNDQLDLAKAKIAVLEMELEKRTPAVPGPITETALVPFADTPLAPAQETSLVDQVRALSYRQSRDLVKAALARVPDDGFNLKDKKHEDLTNYLLALPFLSELVAPQPLAA